jgi:hypothetical protein
LLKAVNFPVLCQFERRASFARIALSGLHGDDAAACDFTAESAEKSAEGAEMNGL